jgi:hypothetical protein
MSDTVPENQGQKTKTSPVVASVLSTDRVVINKGADDGIRVGQRFLIYEVTDEEIVDPVTEESLGLLEEPKGTGRIVSVQKRIAVLESDKEPSGKPRPAMSSIAEMFNPAVMAAFRSPKIGDPVKKIL